jgi:NAD(P)-dependent dehydrogenase (short-subunit alcohol dehydrogenase family)
MQLHGVGVAVTGAGSGLGLATAQRLVAAGAQVTLVDLPGAAGAQAAEQLGPTACFAAADVTERQALAGAFDAADDHSRAGGRGGLRAVVHCAGAGRRMRVLDQQGHAGSAEDFEWVIRLNLLGSFHALSLGAERIARQSEQDGERGVVVLTASVAAFEGQIGQVNYAASKAGIVGMTLVAARDLASRGIRVVSIAPGVVDTPLLSRVRDDVRAGLAASVPHPPRLARPEEFAHLTCAVLENGYLNGETIRLDGALRMAPR